MTKSTIYCDGCEKPFVEGRGWESAPASLSVQWGRPRQTYESFTKEHICYDCVKKIQKAIAECFESLK